MFIAITFMLVGVFLVLVFSQGVVSMLIHWRDKTARLKKVCEIIQMIPMLFMGIFIIAFISQMLLWSFGPLQPTEYYNLPVNEHGTIHYVNGALRRWIWIVTFASAIAAVLPVILLHIITKFRRKECAP